MGKCFKFVGAADFLPTEFLTEHFSDLYSSYISITMTKKPSAGVLAHDEYISQPAKSDRADARGPRLAGALNIVQNPLTVSLVIFNPSI